MKEIVISNGLYPIITQALEEMKSEQGNSFRLEKVNLSELERRTGISRAKLRRLKKNGFKPVTHSKKARKSILDGYVSIIDNLLKQGIKNSSVCFECLKRQGYPGGITIVKDYIFAHKYLLPSKRQQVAPQGNRGRRFNTEPGEAYQMDWGFVNVVTDYGPTIKCACFAMICHHCGQCYIEFFQGYPNNCGVVDPITKTVVTFSYNANCGFHNISCGRPYNKIVVRSFATRNETGCGRSFFFWEHLLLYNKITQIKRRLAL